jgi:lipoate-protein ligase B
MPTPLHITDLGCRDFVAVQELQRRLVGERRQGARPDALLLCSHPPVVTAGRSASAEEFEAASAALAAARIPLRRCERGGRLTYHGPEQVIAYPILALTGPERDLHAYLRGLEAAILATLADLGLHGERHPDQAGVWVGPAKIASLGVAVRGWVTWHGLALNLTGDLSPFGLINPCGVSGLQVTSVAKVAGREIARAAVQERLAAHLCRQFGHTRSAREGMWLPAEEVVSTLGLVPERA